MATSFIFQVERNLQDAMQVARNVLIDPYLLPGGGAAEMALAHVRQAFCLLYLISMPCRF